MKKWMLIFVLTLTLGLCAACGKKEDAQEQPAPAEAQQEIVLPDEATVGGGPAFGLSFLDATVDEIKDFMMVLKDDSDAYYTLVFEDILAGANKPEDFSVGEKVRVTYSGEVTEVDGFTGDILSVEPID